MTSTTYPKSPLKTRVASIIWDNYRLAQTICKGANLCFEKFPKRRLFFQENRGQNLLHCKTKVESCSGFKFSLLERLNARSFIVIDNVRGFTKMEKTLRCHENSQEKEKTFKESFFFRRNIEFDWCSARQYQCFPEHQKHKEKEPLFQ